MPDATNDTPTNMQVLPDPWVASRRVLVMNLFAVGTVAAVLAFVSQYPQPDPLDRYALPCLAGILAVLLAGVRTRKIPDTRAARIAYLALAAYFLASLAYQLVAYVPRTHHLSEATYWFPVVYSTAFIAWRRRAAVGWAGGVFAASLMIGVGLMPYLSSVGALDSNILAFEAQFYAAGVAAILLLNHLTLLQQRYGEARLLAYADFLTGLPNRRCGEILLAQELQHAGPLTVVLFDLDHFKDVNDRYGHDVGDMVLREAARLTARRVRGHHQVVRWGGEEFLLIMPLTDARTAEHLAERIRADIAGHRFVGAGGLTASFGIAVQRPGDTAERLVKRADAALYRAKQLGRNRVKMPTMF